MPIASSDLQFRLSGGSANTDVNLSLGGVKSSQTIADASTHNLFDRVTGDESSAGDTEYRCFYVHNAHATLALQSPKVYIQTQTPSADTSVEIGLDPVGVNGTATTIANEGTAPAGVTFSAATSGSPLTVGSDMAAGQHMAVWIKRIVGAAAAAYNDDSVVVRVSGDTSA